MSDYLREACGVFSAKDFSYGPAFPYVYWGLRAQNHRGHQSHGITTYDGSRFHSYRRLDLVPKIKSEDTPIWLKKLPGYVAIGNVRYTTSGGTSKDALIRGTQPFTCRLRGNKITMAFNGNVVNNSELVTELDKTFPGFSYECDGELICRKLMKELVSSNDLTDAVRNCMEDIEGSFSVTGITKEGELFAFKDSHGIKPLCCGQSEDNKIYSVSSESVGNDINDFRTDFELEPGELVTAARDGFDRKKLDCRGRAFCAFEFAYFARPDSLFDDRYVYEVRENLGGNLARKYSETLKDIDLILSIPETADDAALGFHYESGLRWERASRRHRYVTERAFMMLKNERSATIDRKINILRKKIMGRNIAINEDSVVRGDTTKVIIEKLRKAGAKIINVYVTFPKITDPCFYGIDMATYPQLIGFNRTPEQIAEIIGADGLYYQDVDDFAGITGLGRDKLCMACVTGMYPTPMAQKIANEDKENLEKGIINTDRVYERGKC